MTEVYKYDNIDMSKLSFSIPEKQSNIYYSNITYDNKPLFLQTSKLGILTKMAELNKKLPSIEYEIIGENLDFYDLFMKLDDRLIKETYNRSKEWFNQSIPLENIEDMYKRVCKPLKKNTNPSIRFRLPMEKGNIVSKIYNQNKEIIKIEDIKEKSEAILIIHIRGIKFMKQQYICDIYINQMKVFIPRRNKYIIPEECLIQETLITQSDEEILDDDIILENNLKRQKLMDVKLQEIEKMKELQQKIEMMELEIKNIN
tara:strand:+ start:1239 stop:2012 length:774 start_codon:yes stop_codon:yes gene_type:complete